MVYVLTSLVLPKHISQYTNKYEQKAHEDKELQNECNLVHNNHLYSKI